MLLIAECVAMAALERQESRGGHTRDDFPEMSPEWRKLNLVLSMSSSSSSSSSSDGVEQVSLRRQPIVPMREDLLELFERSELKKYMTDDELTGLPAESEGSH
jgi:succinate dehydrogenase / fumarate reductase, flavoprotein subunit